MIFKKWFYSCDVELYSKLQKFMTFSEFLIVYFYDFSIIDNDNYQIIIEKYKVICVMLENIMIRANNKHFIIILKSK